LINSLIFINICCDSKRDANGSDNEIRVICSEIDKVNVERFLELIFNDTLYTPEPEPFYVLKFSNPSTYSKLKKQTNVIIAAIDRESTNSGLKLINNILEQVSMLKIQNTRKKYTMIQVLLNNLNHH